MPTKNTTLNQDDIRQTGLALNQLYNTSPNAYYYIKGYIQHAIDAKEGIDDSTLSIPEELRKNV